MLRVEPPNRPILKQGIKGEWVVFLQDNLNGSGYGPLNLDGDFGSQTLAEVNRFQKNLGLQVDGIVGRITWTNLDKHKKIIGWIPEWPSSLTLRGIAGADSLQQVQATMIPEAQKFMGAFPRFWGRYFQGNLNFGEYRRALENKPLRNAGIRVLPISRQTNRVDETQQIGEQLGTLHARDVLNTFGESYLASQQVDGFYFFLDVEPTDPLSVGFYLGWSTAVIKSSTRVKFLPAVYLNTADSTTTKNLSSAMKSGAQCHGLWVANYGNNQALIYPWNKDKARVATPVPCKVLMRQYAGDIKNGLYDFNQMNPFLDNQELVLKRLILPPA
jgi:peptidoglycan hydrolase-like protein with peptidoglycan-binding domain